MTDPLPPDVASHEIERLLALLAPLGISLPEQQKIPRYELPPQSSAFARSWLAERGLAPGKYIVLGLGARRPKKQPSTAQVLAWSAHLKQRWNLDTVFMWTPGKSGDPLYPGDDEIARPVLEAASRGQAPQIQPFRGPIPEALGLIWSAGLIGATRPLKTWLSRGNVVRWLDRVTGGVFLGFGLKLALERR